ncbi:MAG TPA: SGNH/GDSL hydrolase family protein [Pseudonocardiaceae bacterium]|jgi:lysophospholipase L1-like esterase|nr:SGNH/GDSL hydrolase family protein [Pseudonocardiaceae bacterium]
MSLPRILAGAAACAAAVLCLSAIPAAAATVSFAALGDSYTSGVGTGDYYSDSGSCDRSPESYAALWATAHSASAFDFAACSGARTADVISGQLGGLSSSTNLVTITVGGNDAGFSTVMEDCILETDSGCHSVVTNAENYVQTTLPGLLDTTYADIRGHAPNATVDVLGYPRFYQVGGSCILGLSDTKRGYINGGADILDSTIAAQVAKFSNFHFVDVRTAFSTHEICSPGEAWLHSVDWTDFTESYHPVADGYRYGDLPTLDTVTG